MILSVEDDGIGIKEESLNELYKNISSEKTENKSFGLRNVNKRIKLYFGNEYGLEIKSKYGEGTKVTITIPLKIWSLEEYVIISMDKNTKLLSNAYFPMLF